MRISQMIQVNKIKEYSELMSKRKPNKALDSFLNNKQTINLPSNLLSLKRASPRKSDSMATRYSHVNANEAKFPRAIETPAYIEQKSEAHDKSVLYKRLSNIRGENKQLGGLSFSKMLARMVVMDEPEEEGLQYHIEQRMRQTAYVRPVEPRVFDMKCQSATGRLTRSIDYDDVGRPSRKLFKKFYMPNSEAAQTIFLQSYNKNDKYIYKEGRRVECKRIHNFYTSHMFRKGYDRCFRQTADSFSLKK